jgi:hypothetical protein
MAALAYGNDDAHSKGGKPLRKGGKPLRHIHLSSTGG